MSGKTELTAEDVQTIQTILERIEGKKEIAARTRDEIRELMDQLEDIHDSFDTGITDIEEGIESIKAGLDQLSMYV